MSIGSSATPTVSGGSSGVQGTVPTGVPLLSGLSRCCSDSRPVRGAAGASINTHGLQIDGLISALEEKVW